MIKFLLFFIIGYILYRKKAPIILWVVLVALCILLKVFSNEDISDDSSCNGSFDFPCVSREDANYNVYIFDPSEHYLGQARGLIGCQDMVNNFARTREITNPDYICCMKSTTSDCAEKHR
jgi:hypothetical protein